MTIITLYIDADACPVKQEIYRVAERHARKGVALKGTPLRRHGRTCSGHPRLSFRRLEDVDARDVGERSGAVLLTTMRGHDELKLVVGTRPW